MKTIKVDTNPDECYAHTRNGCPDIIRLDVWTVASDKITYIEAVNRRGKTLEKSGFRIQTANMDELAARWLIERFGCNGAQNFLADLHLRKEP